MAATATGKPGSSSSIPGSVAAGGTAGQTDVSRVSASPFMSLGGLGTGVTMLGGSSTGTLALPLSSIGPTFNGAKERAAAAARRVPSPEPQPHREKKKKVAWRDDEALVGVRWFRRVNCAAGMAACCDLTVFVHDRRAIRHVHSPFWDSCSRQIAVLDLVAPLWPARLSACLPTYRMTHRWRQRRMWTCPSFPVAALLL